MSPLSKQAHQTHLASKFPNSRIEYLGGTRNRAKYSIRGDEGQFIACATSERDADTERDRKTLDALAGKLHVPRVIDVFAVDGGVYYIYELIDGRRADNILQTCDKQASFKVGKLIGEKLREIQTFEINSLEHLTRWGIAELKSKLPAGFALPPDREEKIVLVHNDFLPHNLILDKSGDKVIGVIDFEWSFVGDPMWDAGYLKWWIDTPDADVKYKWPAEFWDGFIAGFDTEIDYEIASKYAELRSSNGAPPPPISWSS